jgi:hypothetical protein
MYPPSPAAAAGTPAAADAQRKAAGLGRLIAALSAPQTNQQQDQQQNQLLPVATAPTQATATGPILQQFR